VQPVIIECAIDGVTPKSKNPNVPVQPAEIAADALACIAAGAAIIHNHIDLPGATVKDAVARYQEGWRPVLAARPDALIDAYLAMLEDCDLPWAVSVVGGDVVASEVAPLALERGGHLHLGLEFYSGHPKCAPMCGNPLASPKPRSRWAGCAQPANGATAAASSSRAP
jgi:uncharacterized protein (DUF849 family)